MSRRRHDGRAVALIVTPRYLPLLGGMERECALLASELRDRGWRPVVITEQLGTRLPLDEEADGVRIHRVPSSPERSLRVQVGVAVRIARLLVRYRSEAGFAIVRTTTLPAVLVGLLKRLRALPFPTFATAEIGGAADDVVALAELPLFGVSRALVSGNDVLNGICRANVEHLREYGFPPAKIAAIPNGVDTRAWDRASAPERVRRFLYVGRLDPEKGLFELLEAMQTLRASHSDVTLTLAGEGPARRDLEERVTELDLRDAVAFEGLVAYEDLPAVFGGHDCFVLPSYSEGMPLSLLEAAVHRRVIVVTDVGDARELFGDRVHICRPRDAAALAAAMKRALADPAPSADYGDVVARVGIGAVTTEILGRLGVEPAPAPN